MTSPLFVSAGGDPIACPYRVELFRGFTAHSWATLGEIDSLTVIMRRNVAGEAYITLSADHELAGDMWAQNRLRASIFRGERLAYSGWCRPQVQGFPRSLTLAVDDDKVLLGKILGRPLPSSPLSAQTVTHWTQTGPAETVIKALITANLSRFPGVSVAPSQGRGATYSLRARFHTPQHFLGLIDAVDDTHLCWTVEPTTTGLVIDCYEPSVFPWPLREQDGTVTVESANRSRPTATHVVVGDGESETARTFTEYADASRVAQYGQRLEVFADAQDTTDAAELDKRGTEALADGAASQGLSLALSEAGDFTLDHVWLGDLVTVELGANFEVTERLDEIKLDFTAEQGPTVTPTIGDPVARYPGMARLQSAFTRLLRSNDTHERR